MTDETWFSRLYDAALAPCEAMGLCRTRREVVGSAAARVLEIGVGTGLNLPHYRAAASVTAVDSSMAMLRRALRRAAAAQVPAQLLACNAEALPFRDATFDSAVSTCVLCSVADPALALWEIRRVLKPGGTLHLLEHIRAPSPVTARIQDLCTPAWRRIAAGCRLNRETLRLAAEAGFHQQSLHTAFGGVVIRAVLKAPA